MESIVNKIDSKTIWKSRSSLNILQLALSYCDQWLFAVMILVEDPWKVATDDYMKDESLQIEDFKGFRNHVKHVTFILIKFLLIRIVYLKNMDSMN